jgi:predicted phosphoribosyltransferase
VARQAPKRVVVAVPVGARATCDELAALAVEVVCPLTPSAFYAVGEWYDDFAPPTDEAIRKLLAPRAG